MTGQADGIPAWDLDLTPGELRRLAPADKGRRASRALERKVERIELEAGRTDRHDETAYLPGDRAKLRRWKDAGDGLWAWSDPQVDRPDGRNAVLIGRFEAALGILRLRLRKRRGRNAVGTELQARDMRIAGLEAQIARLVGENHELRHRVASTREGSRP